jgi:glyoxylate reductase
MKHTVVVTSELPDIALQILSQENEVVVHPNDGPRSEEELITLLAEADGAVTLLTDPLTRRVLESNPNLRVVGNVAVGYNNIDLEAARECGVTVTNTPGVLTDATADMTVAMILAVTRRLIEGDHFLRSGQFHGWHPLMLLGAELRNRTVGIVGLGRIGAAVAKRLSGFGCRVIYCRRSEQRDADTTAERVSFDELIAISDIVTIHTPLTNETRHLFNAESIARMKKGSYLVNTARGPIVDEGALADALTRGHLAGAALDVYELEPQVESRLMAMENVVLLPHIASATVETRNEMARLAAMNVALVLRGQEPLHRVS